MYKKNGEPTVGFLSSLTMLCHTGQFWSSIS